MLSWLRRFGEWLLEARLMWEALLVVALALAGPLLLGASELQIRVIGFILQLSGVGTVALGIHETRRLFDRPGLLTLTQEWLLRFPRWHLHRVLASGTAAIGIGTARGFAYVRSPDDPSAPVGERLAALVKNVERLEERLDDSQRDVESHLRKSADALRVEQESRAHGDDQLQRRLEIAQAGGLHISAIGLLWLAVGLVLGTFARELALLTASAA